MKQTIFKEHLSKTFTIIFKSYEIEGTIKFLQEYALLSTNPKCGKNNCPHEMNMIKSNSSLDKYSY